MNKLNVFVYGTCQGGAIAKFLKESDDFNDNYNITEEVLSYMMINENTPNWSDDNDNLKTADLLLYQPVNDSYGKNSTNYVKSLLKNGCVTISMPYVYNTATFPILIVMKRDVSDEWHNNKGDRRVFLNHEVIDALIASGLRRNNILSLYDHNKIDFKFDLRFRDGMAITKAKEENLNVKVHDFIIDNISKQKLFMYCSHPTSALFSHMANQILSILGIPMLAKEFPMDFAGITGFGIPNEMPTCSNSYFKFEFNTPQGEIAANAYYRYLIIEYLKSVNCK
jgi:hypothetical protein